MNRILKAVLLTLVLTSFTSGPMFRSQNKPEVILYTDFISLDFGEGGGATMINVTCNTTWTASKIGTFISISPTSSTGSGKLTITATDNTGSLERTGNVIITAGSKSVEIAVYQSGGLIQ